MSDLSPRNRFELRGVHVLAMTVGFFCVVVGVDVTFALSAYRTFPGEVSRTPYEDGIAFNRHLAQMQAQSKLGWTPVAEVTPRGEVRIAVRDAAGAPLSGLSLVGRLEHPATEAGRIVLHFQPAGPGQYLARPGRLAGAWDLTLALTDAKGRRFEAERRLTWP